MNEFIARQKTNSRRSNKLTGYSLLDLFATLIVDNEMELYADGILMGKSKKWNVGRVRNLLSLNLIFLIDVNEWKS